MIFFLTGCLPTDAGEIRITCEDAGSCDLSSDVDPPNYAGGYNTKRCEEAPIATGYAVGDVVPDLQFYRITIMKHSSSLTFAATPLHWLAV